MNHTTDIEALQHGVTRQWLYDHHILILGFPEGANRQAIDTWQAALLEAGNNWPTGRTFLAVHDSRKSGFSQYFRQKALEAGQKVPPHLTGRAAVVVPQGVIGFLLTLVVRDSGRPVENRIQLRVFTDFDKALVWVKELLP